MKSRLFSPENKINIFENLQSVAELSLAGFFDIRKNNERREGTMPPRREKFQVKKLFYKKPPSVHSHFPIEKPTFGDRSFEKQRLGANDDFGRLKYRPKKLNGKAAVPRKTHGYRGFY